MGRFNEGIIYTNDNCIGCKKCISACRAFGANVSSWKNEIGKVNVSSKCINCGQCLVACEHGARVFRDDLDAFTKAVDSGEKISVLVDPTFYILYPDKAATVLGFLKELGVYKIYDVAFGAEISMFGHAQYLLDRADKTNHARQFIANNCSAINNYIEYINPTLMPYVIPVHSPVMCTAIYARTMLKDNAQFMSLSPCVSQVDELKAQDGGIGVKYTVTYDSIFKLLKRRGYGGEKATSDLTTDGLGNIATYKRGFLEGVSLFFPGDEVFSHYSGNSHRNMEKLGRAIEMSDSSHPLMVTIDACEGGCAEGCAIAGSEIVYSNVVPEYKKIRKKCFNVVIECKNYENYYKYYCEKFKDLDMIDYARVMRDRFRQPYMVPEDAINDIFESMHKDTYMKRNINCRSCGYKSCRELAKAVCNGYARIQDCVHYMNDDLKYAALLDPMSGIYNRNGFEKRAKEILNFNPGKKYVVMVGNVNKLKLVNNLYGVQTGDRVLTYISQTINEMIDDNETCARFGGGSFAVLLEDKPERIERFMQCSEFDAEHMGVFFPVTIRYGVYRIVDNSISLSQIVNSCTYAADKAAMRTVNTFVEYDESMRRDLQVETDITLEMRDAMANGEFQLYFQPQYDHVSGRMVGAEALSRWVKKDGTIISPSLFIPIFEKNGFIKELDRYVWENSLKTVRKWEKMGIAKVPVSVNVSRISLGDDDIADVIEKLYSMYSIDKKSLYFEITESAYANDPDSVIKRVNKIRDLGFMIAMDDFGSGYSSLNLLKDITIDILKLDMGFLRGGTNVEKGNEIIAHIVEMAKTLDLKMVAEGVETKNQADFLTEKGCSTIQGYYYARPMPMEDFEKKLMEEA